MEEESRYTHGQNPSLQIPQLRLVNVQEETIHLFSTTQSEEKGEKRLALNQFVQVILWFLRRAKERESLFQFVY